jgi:hypothetical protein
MFCINMCNLICLNMSVRFCNIREEWQNVMAEIGTCTHGKRLEQIRLLQVQLVRAVDLFNHCYGPRLAAFLFTIFVEILINLCLLSYWGGGHQWVLLVIMTLSNTICIHVMSTVGEWLTTSVRKEIDTRHFLSVL